MIKIPNRSFSPKAIEKTARKLPVNSVLEEQDANSYKKIDNSKYPSYIRRVAEPDECAVTPSSEHEQFSPPHKRQPAWNNDLVSVRSPMKAMTANSNMAKGV